MNFIRKHKNVLISLLIVLCTISIKQTCPIDLKNKPGHSTDLLIKTSPFVTGNTSFSNTDKTYHTILFHPVQVLFHSNSSSFRTQTSSKLLYITSNVACYCANPPILGLICKLQIWELPVSFQIVFVGFLPKANARALAWIYI